MRMYFHRVAVAAVPAKSSKLMPLAGGRLPVDHITTGHNLNVTSPTARLMP